MRQLFRLCLWEPTTIPVLILILPSLRPRLQAAMLVFSRAQGLNDLWKATSITRYLVTGSSRLLNGDSLLMV